MSAATITFQPWLIDYYKTMAAAAGVGTAIKRGASILELAKDLWSADRRFRDLLSLLDKLTIVPSGELRTLVWRLRDMRSTMNRMLDLAGKKGLTNRTLTASSLLALKRRNDELLDVIERFELVLDPAFDRALAQAMDEFERGETVSIDTVL
jgi:hypothetical protein